MTDIVVTPVRDKIKIGMDGRTNKWLRERLAEKGIVLTDSQISQRLQGNANFTGEETIACFEILNLEIKTENV